MSTSTSQPAPAWRSEIIAVIRHARLPCVLLLDERPARLTFEPLAWPWDAERLASELGKLMECEVLLLGSLWGEYDESAHLLRAAVVFIARDEAWIAPPGARWSAAVASDALPWPDASLHEAIASLLAEAAGAPAPLRRPS